MSKVEKERLKRILDANSVDYTSIVFIRKARSTWSSQNKGLCVRLSRTGGGTINGQIDDERRMEEQLTALAEIEDFHIVTNERTRKGSGYWTPVRGGVRVYAAIESYTVAGYVKLVNIPAVIAESWKWNQDLIERGLTRVQADYLQRLVSSNHGKLVASKTYQRAINALIKKGFIAIEDSMGIRYAHLTEEGREVVKDHE